MSDEKYGVSEIEVKRFSAMDLQKTLNENRSLKLDIARLRGVLDKSMYYLENLKTEDEDTEFGVLNEPERKELCDLIVEAKEALTGGAE